MDIKQEILRRYFRELDGERKICRDLHVNRKTVKKYILSYMEARQESDKTGNTDAIQDYVCSAPKYDSTKRSKRKLTKELEEVIDRLLLENQRKKQEGLRKQIRRRVDIYEYLLREGYQIGYTTVCNFIREKEIHKQESYIKQEYIPGEECEFDWAEVKLTIAGVLKRLNLAVFTSSYGNYRYCMLFNKQDTLAFMEAHNEFFRHIGGVYQEMVYDNMRVAIREFVGPNEKTPTDALINLSGWFHFRWRFCNVRRGNEKGHVERSVEYVRRKAFCNKDTFESLETAQKHLVATCSYLNALPSSTGKIPNVLLDQERINLWKYPGQMDCYLTQSLKVDKYSTICMGTNRYSVPDHLVGKMLEVKIYSNELKVYFAHGFICGHERSFGKHHWIISLDHYLKTLSRKPGALHGSLALTQAPETVREVYRSWFINHPRDFVELLQFCQHKAIEHHRLLETAIYVSSKTPDNVSAEKIMAMLGNQPMSNEIQKTDNLIDEIENYANLQLMEISSLISSPVNMGGMA